MAGLHPYTIAEKSQESNKKGGEFEDTFARTCFLKGTLLVTWVVPVTKICAR